LGGVADVCTLIKYLLFTPESAVGEHALDPARKRNPHPRISAQKKGKQM